MAGETKVTGSCWHPHACIWAHLEGILGGREGGVLLAP